MSLFNGKLGVESSETNCWSVDKRLGGSRFFYVSEMRKTRSFFRKLEILIWSEQISRTYENHVLERPGKFSNLGKNHTANHE